MRTVLILGLAALSACQAPATGGDPQAWEVEWVRPTPEIIARCRYEAAAASLNVRGVLYSGVTEMNLVGLCLRAYGVGMRRILPDQAAGPASLVPGGSAPIAGQRTGPNG